jgi:peptidyl-prolyl cis-trans isomerase SurA
MSTKRFTLCLILAVLAVVVPGRQSPAGASVTVDRVVAVVNGDIITMSDLQRESARAAGKIDDRLLLEDMINRKLQMSAAKRSGMDVTEKELNDAIEDILKRNSMDRRQFEAALVKEGLSVEQYRSELKEQITLSRVFNKYVRAGLAVDENELRSYYEKNPRAFQLPEEVHIRQILLRLPEGATPSQVESFRNKANDAAARALKGEDFIALVREYSDTATVALDGDLGFMQRDHALPEIEQAVAPLTPGGIAGPVRSSIGFHILRLEEVRSRVIPFEKVREEISATLFNQKLESTYRNWLQTLRSESTIENRL